MGEIAKAPRRGRPPGASREDVLALTTHRYLRGRRIDVQEIAAELGIGRTTIYRWFGSRDALIGEVIWQAAEPLLAQTRARARGAGAHALLETFDAFNRTMAEAPALLRFVEQEREAAIRVIISGAGTVQPRIVAAITEMIASEVSAGTYSPQVEPATLGYAMVRLAEAFLFNDAAAGMRGDVERLREVQAALLGVRSTRTSDQTGPHAQSGVGAVGAGAQ
ncbi:MAG TPA: QsdR family transcriptional regulator [Solirubrobacteraceae bacterium]|jgi:AcrR family transcriptional regulator|nr:QsdR family transcriptional regulator [Solirubrobacteraceae bacterium]